MTPSSPFANIPLSFFFCLVLSACVSAPSVRVTDRSASVEVAGQRYEAGAGTRNGGWLDVPGVACPEQFSQENAVSTNLTDASYKQWTHFNSGRVEDARIVRDDDSSKIVYLKIRCSEWYKESVNYDVYHLEVNLVAMRDLPCLIVRQRVTNPTAQPQKLNFGSYTSGVSEWAVSGAETKKADPGDKRWLKIVDGDYVWLGKGGSGEKGLGLVSLTPPGFSIFLGHRIFWGYGNSRPVPPGGSVETVMAVMTTDDPDDVRRAAEKVRKADFGEFVTPRAESLPF